MFVSAIAIGGARRVDRAGEDSCEKGSSETGRRATRRREVVKAHRVDYDVIHARLTICGARFPSLIAGPLVAYVTDPEGAFFLRRHPDPLVSRAHPRGISPEDASGCG